MDFYWDHPVLIIDSIRKKSNSMYNRTNTYNRNLRVITTHKFSNKYSVYKYDNIYVSGGHIVKENDSWVTVAESLKGTSVYVKPPLLYCLSTSTGEIKINDTIFKDFEGSTNKFINSSFLLSWM